MNTSKQTFTSRTEHRVFVFATHALLLGILSACTGSPQGTSTNDDQTTSATKSNSASDVINSSKTSNVAASSDESKASELQLASAQPETKSDDNEDSNSELEQDPVSNDDIGIGPGIMSSPVIAGSSPTVSSPDTGGTSTGGTSTGGTSTGGTSTGGTSTGGLDTPPAEKHETQFISATTPGFTGEVLEDTIRLKWNSDPDAAGYNIYKQAKYYDTVFATEYIDKKVFDTNYYYEIQAFDRSGPTERWYYVATGLTVKARSLGKPDPNPATTNEGILDDYELVFSDEFNGTMLDASKWNTSYLWGSNLVINNEEQYYVDILKDPEFGYNPFTFDGNHLIINSIETPDHLSNKAMKQPYLSGVITSYDAFSFTYGYVETRAKMTHGRGYWPAFWLLNHKYGGMDPEIDIMEFIGSDQDVVYHTYHYYDRNDLNEWGYPKLRSTKSQPTVGIDFTSDFHTFAVEWKPGTIIYFVDGVEVHRVDDTMVSNENMYIIANTAIGGWWAGSPDAFTPFPGTYIIDYIRAYQKPTVYSDEIYNDSGNTSNIPLADDIDGETTPSHRPPHEEWADVY